MGLVCNPFHSTAWGLPLYFKGQLGIEVIMDLGEVRIPYDPVKDRKAKGEIHD